MVMDPRFSEFTDSVNGFRVHDGTALPNFTWSPNLSNGFKFKDESLALNFVDRPSLPPDPGPGSFGLSSSATSEVDSSDDNDSDPVLKYLNQMLIEENFEDKPCMFYDPLALQAAEKPFYEVLGKKYPPSPSPYQPSLYINQNVESPESHFGSSSEYSTNSSTSTSNSTIQPRIVEPVEDQSSCRLSPPPEDSTQSTLQMNSQLPFGSVNNFSNNTNDSGDSFASTQLVPEIFSDRESILLFKKGMEEASKFLPRDNLLTIDLDKYALPPKSKEVSPKVVVKVEKDERDYFHDGSRRRKHYRSEDSDPEEERSRKQAAANTEESKLSDMFDKVLLFTEAKGEPACCVIDAESQSEASKTPQQNGEHRGFTGGNNGDMKQDNKLEVVDLGTLLISCAQSVAANDRKSANEQLKQIRQHSSPRGDASQRVAHIFANGLEARLAGTGTQISAFLASQRISAAEKLKAFQLYLSASPFKKISLLFANKMIFYAASKAKTLHIIDFGILYGFQWPILIQYLSTRPCGPPKLRLTGIELPLPGFRPAERVEDTGRRLAKYCERFNVPFEYNAIATQNWETIKIEDIKIGSNEVVAVNCMFRFKNLLDETVVEDSPRDVVLNLIRKMNPDIFVQSVVNGLYNAPFFVTRFREALFHYSASFDMLDTTISRKDQQRLDFEREFYGREVMNVIACEGLERVERPETYKQWQVRNVRAGFRLLPLNRDLVKKLHSKVKSGFHKDFLFNGDGHWMLQGWKGRILCASACWEPA